jgi:hypothetical protein
MPSARAPSLARSHSQLIRFGFSLRATHTAVICSGSRGTTAVKQPGAACSVPVAVNVQHQNITYGIHLLDRQAPFPQWHLMCVMQLLSVSSTSESCISKQVVHAHHRPHGRQLSDARCASSATASVPQAAAYGLQRQRPFWCTLTGARQSTMSTLLASSSSSALSCAQRLLGSDFPITHSPPH